MPHHSFDPLSAASLVNHCPQALDEYDEEQERSQSQLARQQAKAAKHQAALQKKATAKGKKKKVGLEGIVWHVARAHVAGTRHASHSEHFAGVCSQESTSHS